MTRATWAALATLVCAGCSKDEPERADTNAIMLRGATLPAAEPAPHGVACGPHGLPPEQHFVAEGLCARVMAHRQGSTRGLTFAPNGDLFVITTDGEIRRYRDSNGDGIFAPSPPETIVWARTNGAGHNCQLEGEHLYCGDKSGVKRWKWSAESSSGEDGEDVVVSAPSGGRHPRHPIGLWDGWLYVVSGSAKNGMAPMPATYDEDRGVVRRFPVAKLSGAKPMRWRDGELVVRGIRNATAMGRHPDGRILAVDNGLDDLRYRGEDVHEDNPAEIIVAIDKGKAYGWPFCFYAQRIVRDGEVLPLLTPLSASAGGPIPIVKQVLNASVSNKDDAWCAAHVARPLSFLQAHSSALALLFVPSAASALPPRYHGGALVALHGSWDRARSTGNKIVFLPGAMPMPIAAKDGTGFPYEVVFGGGRYGAPKDGEWSWKVGDASEDPVRPVGLAISPVDGALYVSSDNAHAGGDSGAIYRIAILGR